ncbi:MAG: hypothetical protein KIH69_012410 [Anaerolineae bacterium]|nr:hypothetical protein [Anaerolineae bacterium]
MGSTPISRIILAAGPLTASPPMMGVTAMMGAAALKSASFTPDNPNTGSTLR